MIWCFTTYIIAYVKTQKIRFIIHHSNLQPNCGLKFDFQNVDQVIIKPYNIIAIPIAQSHFTS